MNNPFFHCRQRSWETRDSLYDTRGGVSSSFAWSLTLVGVPTSRRSCSVQLHRRDRTPGALRPFAPRPFPPVRPRRFSRGPRPPRLERRDARDGGPSVATRVASAEGVERGGGGKREGEREGKRRRRTAAPATAWSGLVWVPRREGTREGSDGPGPRVAPACPSSGVAPQRGSLGSWVTRRAPSHSTPLDSPQLMGSWRDLTRPTEPVSPSTSTRRSLTLDSRSRSWAHCRQPYPYTHARLLVGRPETGICTKTFKSPGHTL